MIDPNGRKGLFITFEGPEGCGKSTQIRRLARRLEAEGLKPVLTREPGGTDLADRLRDILLKENPGAILPRVELFLLLAARSDHVERLIAPAIGNGKIVLSDRFFDSTVAYQGAGRNLDLDVIQLLNHYATGGLTPDLTFLLKLNPEEGLRRVASVRLDRFEQESLEFHERVLNGFLRLAEENPQRFEVIDGTKGEEEISNEIYQKLWIAFPTFDRT